MREIFGKSWELTKKHLWFLVLLFLVTAIIQGVTNEMDSVAGLLLNMLLGACVFVAWTRVSLDIISGKEPSIDAIGGEFNNFLTYLFAYVVFQVAFVVGLILLIIPGIYVAVTYGWFGYLIAEKHYGVQESLKQSAKLVEGTRWQILKFLFAIVGLNIVGLLALVIGLFVTIPMSMVACALVYRALVLHTSPAVTPVIPASVPPLPTA